MSFIFNEIIYRPIFNLLVLITNLVPWQDFGLAIIVLTVLIRLLFMPFSVKTLRSQKLLSKLQPKIKEIQEKFKNDRAAQAQATMALYKDHQVNPLAGCLPLLVQIPILFALYRAFVNGLQPESLNLLYSFIQNPGIIKNLSFGFLDLAKSAPLLAIISGAFQFIHSKLTLTKSSSSAIPNKNNPPAGGQPASLDFSAMNKQMLYFFPVMIIIIGWRLPAGLVLYWTVSTLFSIFEQFYINKTSLLKSRSSADFRA